MELLYGDSQPNVDIQAELATYPLWVRKAISLYGRCVMFNEIALPQAGGVIDQDEMTVAVLERIHRKVNQIMADRMEERARRMNKHDGKAIDSIQIGHSYWERRQR